jgi:hypothetical protein
MYSPFLISVYIQVAEKQVGNAQGLGQIIYYDIIDQVNSPLTCSPMFSGVQIYEKVDLCPDQPL